MTTKLIKWGAIFALMVGVGWTSFQWGQSDAMKDAAEKRQEAIQQAIEKREAEYRSNLKSVQNQATALQERLNKANEKLDKKDSRIEDLKDGDKACFGEESLKLYNQY